MATLPKIPDIAKQVESNKTDILSKLDRGSFTGSANDLELLGKTSAIQLAKGEDLNNLGDQKAYLSGNTNWDSYINSPYPNSAFYIENKSPYGGGGTRRTQIAYPHINSASPRWRTINGTTSTAEASPWYEFFTQQNCPISKQQNGYCKLANGMIMQWGQVVFESVSINTQVQKSITLPVVFSSANYSVTSNVSHAFSTDKISTNHNTKSASSFIMRVCQTAIDSTSNALVDWIAIGY